MFNCTFNLLAVDSEDLKNALLAHNELLIKIQFQIQKNRLLLKGMGQFEICMTLRCFERKTGRIGIWVEVKNPSNVLSSIEVDYEIHDKLLSFSDDNHRSINDESIFKFLFDRHLQPV